MANFTKVESIPENIDSKTEMVIKIDFSPNLEIIKSLIPKDKMMTNYFSRKLLTEIGNNYVGPGFQALHMNVSHIEGVPFGDEEDILGIIYSFLSKYYPQILDSYVDFKITNRPHGIKTIYFVGDHLRTLAFDKHGIEEVKPNKKKKGK